MTTQDVLREAKAILSDPARWNNKGGFARNACGEEVYCTGDPAERWCAVGAISVARGNGYGWALGGPAVEALAAAIGAEDWSDVIFWNDAQATHEEVIAAFDRALLAVAKPAEQREVVPA
jgi:hypothetical protein